MVELAEHFPEDARAGVRTSTCAALDDVELVCIRGEHFRELVADSSELRDRLLERAKKLLGRDAAAKRWLDKPLGDFLEQGLFNAQKLLVLDLESCTRCDECTKACADTHGGVTRLIREGLRFDKFLVASSCRSCLDPYCLVGCPVDAIHRKQRDEGPDREDLPASLEIVIDDRCIGCGLCARNCPYGNISLHDTPDQREDPSEPGRSIAVQQTKAVTCDLCRDVVGADQDPSCVYACPHNAAFRMSGRELIKLVTRDARASELPSASGQIDSTASF
jgi:Fe-S-cluster-containing hydrogenase component 2